MRASYITHPSTIHEYESNIGSNLRGYTRNPSLYTRYSECVARFEVVLSHQVLRGSFSECEHDYNDVTHKSTFTHGSYRR